MLADDAEAWPRPCGVELKIPNGCSRRARGEIEAGGLQLFVGVWSNGGLIVTPNRVCNQTSRPNDQHARRAAHVCPRSMPFE